MDKELTKVSYEEVSMNISDHIARYEVRLNNGSKIRYEASGSYQNPYFDESITYSGFFLNKDNFIKCIGHSVKKQYRKVVHGLTLFYNFSDGFGKHYITIHYPNQLMASIRNFRYFLNPIRDPNEKISVRWFDVHEMEVLKRRNKKNKSCLDLDDELGYDNYVLLKHGEKPPYCLTPYQKYDNTRPICSTKEEMKEAAFVFKEGFDEIVNPCKSMSNIRYEMQELFVPYSEYSSIGMVLPEKIRVIQQSKAIDIDSLIGYIGGYVGIIVGKHH